MNKVRTFRWIANLEGVSFLLLLLVAMPLKYIWDKPWLTQQIGMAHGVLFVAYVVAVFFVRGSLRWNFLTTLVVLALSFVPLGTFYVTERMMRMRPATGL